MLQVPRKRRPPDGSHLEAWTLSLVIDFWRRDAPVSQTPGTLQEDDLVLKKCIEENSNLGFYSEAWTLSLVIDFWRRDAPVTHTPGTLQEDDLVLKKCIQETNISMKMHFYSNTTYNYKQILPHRRL